jgi:hypothetical protein
MDIVICKPGKGYDMKLTASQLRRIIKEEVSRVLSESRTLEDIQSEIEMANQQLSDVTTAAIKHINSRDLVNAKIAGEQIKELRAKIERLIGELIVASGETPESFADKALDAYGFPPKKR